MSNENVFNPNLNKVLIKTEITDIIDRKEKPEVEHIYISKAKKILDTFYS